MQTSRGVDDHRVVQQRFRFLRRLFRDVDRIAVLADLEEGHLHVVCNNAELIDCRRTIDVCGNKQRTPPAIFQMQRKFAGGCRLAGALQANHHHDGRTANQRQADFGAAEELLELVADDFGDLLRGRECGQHIFADCFLSDAIGEFLDDFEVNVGLEQSDANFLQRVVDMPLVELGLAAQGLEDPIHLVLEVVEHRALEAKILEIRSRLPT